MYFNARSLAKPGAIDNLSGFCDLEDIDVVMVCETWLNAAVSDAELSLSDRYYVFRRDRGSRGGGVLILVKKTLKCCNVNISSDAEVVAVDVFFRHNAIRFVCFYLSNAHGGVKTCQVDELGRVLSLIGDKYPVVVTGDCNLPKILWQRDLISDERSVESVFTNMCIRNALTQLVREFTRIVDGQAPSILDLVLTSDPDLIDNLLVTQAPVFSDHKGITFNILTEADEIKNTNHGLNFWKAEYEKIENNLILVSWTNFFKNTQSAEGMYVHFVDYLHFLITLFVPKRAVCTKHANLRKHIEQLKILMNNDPSLATDRKLHKAVSRLRLLEESALSFRNSKEFFRYANKRLKGKTSIGALRNGSKIVSDDYEKAELFKDFFASVYSPGSPEAAFSQSAYTDCSSAEITYDAVFRHLKNLPMKCSITPDGIPPIFYKKLARYLAEPLRLILSRSYEEGVIPKFFRHSLVTPIHKSKSLSDVENYRPVAQESIACLIIEKVLAEHIFSFLSAKGLLDENQHGFTKGKSTATQLVRMTQDWAMYGNSKTSFDCVYFDFSKAFDRVNHSLLLGKLRHVGVDFKTLRWISSYLQNRTFCVNIDGKFSTLGLCPSGVPQGSVLGPLLFCIFILDLKDALPKGVTHKLYADDLKIYCPSNTASAQKVLQSAIDAVASWCVDNHMLISVPKCSVLSSRKTKSIYKLNGVDIPVNDSVKDLGIVISPDLNFDDHITHIVKSSHTLCNMIMRCFISRHPQFYVHLYKSLVIPKFAYCCEVWRPYLKKHKDAIENVQTRFIRRVSARCGIPKDAVSLRPITELFDKADWKMYHRLCKFNAAKDFFEIRQNNLRSGHTVKTLAVARTERLNNVFAWRMAPKLR